MEAISVMKKKLTRSQLALKSFKEQQQKKEKERIKTMKLDEIRNNIKSAVENGTTYPPRRNHYILLKYSLFF